MKWLERNENINGKIWNCILWNFLPLFWNTRIFFQNFTRCLATNLYGVIRSILCIHSSYRDVNYSEVAISKRTRSNLTKRICTRLSIARKLYHCVVSFSNWRKFCLSNSTNESSFYFQNYIYHPQKKKKKKKEHPLYSISEFPFSKIFNLSFVSLSHWKLFPSFSSKWPEISIKTHTSLDLALTYK